MKINSKMIFLVLFIILASTAPVLASTLTDVIMGILTFVIGDALDGIMAYFDTIAILAAWTPFILLVLLVILPAITVYTIIYGFLMEIRIFRNKTVNLIIALSIGSSAIFLPLPPFGVPVFGLLVAFLFGAMAWWAIFVFSIMFFVGVWYLFLTRRAKWGTTSAVYGAYQDEAKGLSFELRAINESLADAMRRMAKETDPNTRAGIEASVRELTDRKNDLSERIREMEEIRRRL